MYTSSLSPASSTSAGYTSPIDATTAMSTVDANSQAAFDNAYQSSAVDPTASSVDSSTATDSSSAGASNSPLSASSGSSSSGLDSLMQVLEQLIQALVPMIQSLAQGGSASDPTAQSQSQDSTSGGSACSGGQCPNA